MLQDLYPNSSMHHVDPELRRAESAESDVLLKTATDELIMVINGMKGEKDERTEGPSGQESERDEVKTMAMADRALSAPLMPPGVETALDQPSITPSMSPIMKRLNQLEEIMVGVKNSQFASGKDEHDGATKEDEGEEGHDDKPRLDIGGNDEITMTVAVTNDVEVGKEKD